jgi:hypothetical protein
MIGYTLKHVLELVPEVLPLVKQASIEAEFPVTSRDNCLASALVINYKKNFTSDVVDYDVLEKVAEAVTLYNLKDQVNNITGKMISRSTGKMLKQASIDTQESLMLKQAQWEGDLSGFVNPKEMAERAEEIFEKAASVGAPVSEKIKLYAGDGYLSKEAVLGSLGVRFEITKDDIFVKLAAAVGREPEFISSPRTVKSLCSTVTRLDDKYGLFASGYDFYKEAMIEKSAGFASSSVNISGKNYPLDAVRRIPGAYLDDYLGKGFSKELESDPNSAKHLVESLPADSQQILVTILKNTGC